MTSGGYKRFCISATDGKSYHHIIGSNQRLRSPAALTIITEYLKSFHDCWHNIRAFYLTEDGKKVLEAYKQATEKEAKWSNTDLDKNKVKGKETNGYVVKRILGKI